VSISQNPDLIFGVEVVTKSFVITILGLVRLGRYDPGIVSAMESLYKLSNDSDLEFFLDVRKRTGPLGQSNPGANLICSSKLDFL